MDIYYLSNLLTERNTSPQEQSGRARGEVGTERTEPQVAQGVLCQSAKA